MQKLPSRAGQPVSPLVLFLHDAHPFTHKNTKLLHQPLSCSVISPTFDPSPRQPYAICSLPFRPSVLRYAIGMVPVAPTRTYHTMLYIPLLSRQLDSIINMVAALLVSLPDWSVSIGLHSEIPPAEAFFGELRQQVDAQALLYQPVQFALEMRLLQSGTPLTATTIEVKSAEEKLRDRMRKREEVKEQMQQEKNSHKETRTGATPSHKPQAPAPETSQPSEPPAVTAALSALEPPPTAPERPAAVKSAARRLPQPP